jgi:DNA invertase Pin-like site-specific DNA recombinase
MPKLRAENCAVSSSMWKQPRSQGGLRENDQFLKRSSVRVLLVKKTDRLYRNVKDYVTVDELDLEIHFVKENVVVSRVSHPQRSSCTESKS